MYESPKYNVQKIKDFADTITGFEAVLNTAKLFQAAENNRNNPNPKTLSARLLRLALRQRGTTPSSGKFPYSEMGELLGYFRDIFDEKQAKKDGTIKPKVMVVYALLPCSVLHLIPFNSILSCFLYPFTPLSLLYFYYLTLLSSLPFYYPPPQIGVNPDYDSSTRAVAAINNELQEYLRQMKAETGVNALAFWGTNKDRFQVGSSGCGSSCDCDCCCLAVEIAFCACCFWKQHYHHNHYHHTSPPYQHRNTNTTTTDRGADGLCLQGACQLDLQEPEENAPALLESFHHQEGVVLVFSY